MHALLRASSRFNFLLLGEDYKLLIHHYVIPQNLYDNT
jgi:hypothetical protein